MPPVDILALLWRLLQEWTGGLFWSLRLEGASAWGWETAGEGDNFSHPPGWCSAWVPPGSMIPILLPAWEGSPCGGWQGRDGQRRSPQWHCWATEPCSPGVPATLVLGGMMVILVVWSSCSPKALICSRNLTLAPLCGVVILECRLWNLNGIKMLALLSAW